MPELLKIIVIGLGSPFVSTNPGVVYFGLNVVNDGYMYGSGLYYTNGSDFGNRFGVRPVVSLSSNISLEEI